MGLTAKDTGGDGFEPIPAGTYAARCVSVIDLGVQETPWGGKEKVYIGFEVPEERVKWTDKEGNDQEGPAFIGSRYTLSINEKSILGQHLTSWRGKPFTDEERQGFDISAVLGAPCMISVTHAAKGDKVYANINSIMRLPKGMAVAPAESELISYTPMDNEKAANFDKLQEWQKKLVRTGYKMADDSTVIGSATSDLPHRPALPSTVHPAPQEGQSLPPTPDPEDYFDDDIPF